MGAPVVDPEGGAVEAAGVGDCRPLRLAVRAVPQPQRYAYLAEAIVDRQRVDRGNVAPAALGPLPLTSWTFALSECPTSSTPLSSLPGRPAHRGSGGIPARVVASQPQYLDVPAGRRPAGPAAHRPGGPAAADDVAMPAQDRIRGDQQAQPLAPPSVSRRARSRAMPGLPSPGSRDAAAAVAVRRAGDAGSRSRRSSRLPYAGTAGSHKVIRVIRRKANHRHMTGDHHDRTLGGNPAGQSRGRDSRHAQSPARQGVSSQVGLRSGSACLGAGEPAYRAIRE